MSWKNSLPYFAFQSVKHAKNWAHFQKIWAYQSRWQTALQPGHNSVADEQAWITFAALDYLDAYLQPTHKVFEYGGGGSTLFFGKRVDMVATVENDREWFKILTEKIKEKGYAKWQGFFVEGEIAGAKLNRSPSDPADFMSNAPGQENISYEQYAKTIHQFPENHFDVVLVDGRVRPSCIQESLKHLKSGGLLVVDNMERDYYWTAFRDIFANQFTTEVDMRCPVPFHPDFTITLVLKKK